MRCYHKISTLIIFSGHLISSAQAQDKVESEETKLIIQITLDQFKADYLERFKPAFKYGFKRVLEGGFVIKNAFVDHAITDSYPGHASLSTGMFPRNHGLSANAWWTLKEGGWQSISADDDRQTTIVGSSGRIGTSAKHMTASTIADWVKTSNPSAKAISLSAGTKIAMAYGGKSADAIYWLDRPTGRFVSSSYYIDEYPKWINDFNDITFGKLKKKIWKNTVPVEYRSLAEPDASSYENSGVNFTFPHEFEREKPISSESSVEEQFNRWFYNLPMADEALFVLAEHAITHEQLGQDAITDYLSITVNTTDNVGHDFGGRSQEILDTLVRIDRSLDGFINFLDKKVGKNGYVIAIGGDHGGPEVIEYQQQEFGTGARISQQQVDVLLDAVEMEVKSGDKQGEALISAIEAIMEGYDYVFDAITQREIDAIEGDKNPYMELYRKTWINARIPSFPLRAVGNREHHPARYGIFAQFQKNTTSDGAAVVHGSPYDYDRRVPIIFYGANIKAAEAGQDLVARTVDVAPTLAKYANIKFPGTLDGISLLEN